MGLSFKVAPGVRIGASSGVGSAVAAHERELRAAQREADIEKAAALERSLVSLHLRSFPKARRSELPPPDPVDPGPVRERVEREVGVPALVEELGGTADAPPRAADPQPVDRYELMRSHRKRERQGIPLFRVGDRIRAAHRADRSAEEEAAREAARRADAQQVEQQRLDKTWSRLQAARRDVDERLKVEVELEERRLAAIRAAEQAELDAEWAKLEANDPATTIAVLEAAFADNDSPAAPIDCDGDRIAVALQFPPPESVVPERKPDVTPGGKPTLKKRTKTEVNALYLAALGSNVLATVAEAFAVAPGTRVVQMLVVRRETEGKQVGELAAIYAGEFPRSEYENASRFDDPGSAVSTAPEAILNLKGQARKVAALDVSTHPDLEQVLNEVADGLKV